jgi:hypothetical protein
VRIFSGVSATGDLRDLRCEKGSKVVPNELPTEYDGVPGFFSMGGIPIKNNFLKSIFFPKFEKIVFDGGAPPSKKNSGHSVIFRWQFIRHNLPFRTADRAGPLRLKPR